MHDIVCVCKHTYNSIVTGNVAKNSMRIANAAVRIRTAKKWLPILMRMCADSQEINMPSGVLLNFCGLRYRAYSSSILAISEAGVTRMARANAWACSTCSAVKVHTRHPPLT